MNAAIEPHVQDQELWFLNTLVAIRRPSAAGSDGVSIIEHCMPFGEAPPQHVHHDEDEVFHILEGRIRFRVGDREQVAGPGETLVAPRGLPHAFRVESERGARCLTLTTGSGFEGLVRAMARPALGPHLPPPSAPTTQMIAALGEAAARNGIDLLGPPLA